MHITQYVTNILHTYYTPITMSRFPQNGSLNVYNIHTQIEFNTRFLISTQSVIQLQKFTNMVNHRRTYNVTNSYIAIYTTECKLSQCLIFRMNLGTHFDTTVNTCDIYYQIKLLKKCQLIEEWMSFQIHQVNHLVAAICKYDTHGNIYYVRNSYQKISIMLQIM